MYQRPASHLLASFSLNYEYTKILTIRSTEQSDPHIFYMYVHDLDPAQNIFYVNSIEIEEQQSKLCTNVCYAPSAIQQFYL